MIVGIVVARALDAARPGKLAGVAAPAAVLVHAAAEDPGLSERPSVWCQRPNLCCAVGSDGPGVAVRAAASAAGAQVVAVDGAQDDPVHPARGLRRAWQAAVRAAPAVGA
jgi:hypothetical protein